MIYGHPLLAEKLRRRARWRARFEVAGALFFIVFALAVVGALIDRV